MQTDNISKKISLGPVMLSLICSLVLIGGCAAKVKPYVKHIPNSQPFSEDISAAILLKDQSQPVRFHGIISDDGTSTATGQILYPGGGAGVFLVSVLTHAVTAEAMKNSAKNAKQEAADQVLTPLQSTINDMSLSSLHSQLSKHPELPIPVYLEEQVSTDNTSLQIAIEPVFLISQDLSYISMNTALTVLNEDVQKPPLYQNVVEILHEPVVVDTEIRISYWQENLNDIAANLFAESLQIGLSEMLNHNQQEGGAPQTIRYNAGGVKKVERGILISETCKRILFRTLRGWLKSVPPHETGNKTICMNETQVNI